MKYILNRCANIFQGEDITIHYISDDNGIKILTFCPSYFEKYLEKTKRDITSTS